MTKKEQTKYINWFKQDLARYLKNDFIKYRQLADTANITYKKRCLIECNHDPIEIYEWQKLAKQKNIIHGSILKRIPLQFKFGEIYSAFNTLYKNNSINDIITHPEVIDIMSKQQLFTIGKVRPVGTLFYSSKTKQTYKIEGFMDNCLVFSHNNYRAKVAIAKFQTAIKARKIQYVEEN